MNSSTAVSGGVQRTITQRSALPLSQAQDSLGSGQAPLHHQKLQANLNDGSAALTAPPKEEQIEDDDEWMDWETRKEQIPIGKHIIAGKLASKVVKCQPV